MQQDRRDEELLHDDSNNKTSREDRINGKTGKAVVRCSSVVLFENTYMRRSIP
jgi:hypothetical protein